MRAGGILAAGAFLVSFILSLISGAPFLQIIIRALVFAALFFGIGFGLNYLVKNIFSGDMSALPAGDGQRGHIVDISVGDETDGVESGGGIEGGGDGGRRPAGVGPAFIVTGGDIPDDGELDDISTLFDSSDKPSAAPTTSGSKKYPQAGTDKAPSALEETLLDSGGLAQNTDYSYNKVGSVVNPVGSESAPPKVANPLKDAEAGAPDGGITDFNGFIPGMPGVESVFPKGTEGSPRGESGGGEGKITVGTVEMSVEKPKQEVDLGKYKDGKKMAGAIQTMLKKDNE